MKIAYSPEKLANYFIENKEKILKLVIVMIALIVAFNIYMNQARIFRLLNKQRDIETKKNAVLSEIKQSEKKIEFYKGMLKERDNTAIINTVKNIARDSKVKLISVEPGNEERQDAYARYPFFVSIAAGSYHEVGKFVSKIEDYSDLYSVSAITITPLKESQSAGQPLAEKLTVNLILTVTVFTG